VQPQDITWLMPRSPSEIEISLDTIPQMPTAIAYGVTCRPPLVMKTSYCFSPPSMPRRRIVFEAWLLNAVNPKGTAFMLAVVPQFLTAGEPLLPQYLVIGATLGLTDLVVNILYAALAARLLGALRTPARRRAINRVFGGLFVALGVLLATFKRA